MDRITSIAIERFNRRPSDSCMPRQFRNDSEITQYEGTVEIVRSQFCTLIVVRVTEITSPSTP
ncbi:MAG: hypothetical protein Ct9H300mP1_27000 [Planctomycetaceae bacterium]|nr:MAG: hypothetical protein Ct9H300mP1_27000 [Planctomycetaceae bacterium]